MTASAAGSYGKCGRANSAIAKLGWTRPASDSELCRSSSGDVLPSTTKRARFRGRSARTRRTPKSSGLQGGGAGSESEQDEDEGQLGPLLICDQALPNERASVWLPGKVRAFVLEDIARRETRAHPQSQLFFWRTAAARLARLIRFNAAGVICYRCPRLHKC